MNDDDTEQHRTTTTTVENQQEQQSQSVSHSGGGGAGGSNERRGLESEATTLYATVCCIRDIRHNVLHSQSVLLLLVQPQPHTSSYTCCLPLKFTYLLSGNVCIIRRAFWCTLDDDDEDYDGHGGTVTAKVKTRHAVFTLLHYIFSVASDVALLYLCRVHFTRTNDFRTLTSLCTTSLYDSR